MIISAKYMTDNNTHDSVRIIEFTYDSPILTGPFIGETKATVNKGYNDTQKERRAPGSVDWLKLNSPSVFEESLSSAKEKKQQQINNIPKNQVSLEDEVLERASAKGVNDNTVKQYAKEMGITPAQAVTEMRKKRNNKAVTIGKILGRKDKYQAALDAATTVAQVNAITVDYDSAPVANKNLK